MIMHDHGRRRTAPRRAKEEEAPRGRARWTRQDLFVFGADGAGAMRNKIIARFLAAAAAARMMIATKPALLLLFATATATAAPRGCRAFVLLAPAPSPRPSSAPSSGCQSMAPFPPIAFQQSARRSYSSSGTAATIRRREATRLHVFDFFKQRTSEGLQQLSNLADASYRGELGRGLADAARYTAEANRAFAEGLALSRQKLLRGIEALLTGTDPEKLLEELEDVLLQADLGAQTTEDILREVDSFRRSDAASFGSLNRDDLMSVLRGKLVEALDVRQPRSIQFSPDPSVPTVLFIMGANGMGKTTTIGKLAHRLRVEGNQTVLLAACDTFRAGAVEQLQLWAERAHVAMVGPTDQAKTPAAVLYSALDAAVRGSVDVVLVDTSGRLSNNDALTQELAKMKRVIQKRLSVEDDEDGAPRPNLDVPHETLLVLDAAQGRMALDSARTWNRELGLTGLVLTKLDGSARGGSVVAISRDLQLPVKLIGVGEGMEDLRDFEPELFVDGLLGIGQAGGKKSRPNEGKVLADRLVTMRQERDARARERVTVGATGVVAPASAGPDAAATTTVPQGRSGPPAARGPNKSSKKKRKNRK